MKRGLVSWLVGLVLVGAVAPAGALVTDTIFIPERRQELCGSLVGRVDRHRLLQAVVDDANVPLILLDRANPGGNSDGSVTPDELFYALTAMHPFGRPAAELGEAAKGAAQRLATVRGLLNDFAGGGGATSKGYRVIRSETGAVRARDIFSASPTVVVECVAIAADTPSTPSSPVAPGERTEPPSVLQKVNQRLRVRGKVEELGISRDALQGADAEYAEISFKRDEKGHSDTFRVNAVIGVDLSGLIGPDGWSFIPYVHYERTDLTPDSETVSDVHTVSPGALIGKRFLWSRASLDFGLTPEATFDIAQKSRVIKSKFYLTPSFRIGPPGESFPFLGGYMDEIGPFAVRPAAGLIGELAYVADKGTNAALEDQRSYFGLGAEMSLDVRMPGVPVFSNILAGVRYRHLQLFGAHLANAHQLKASLDYEMTPFVAAGLAYVDGHNSETFQKERYWNLSLKLRY